MSDPRRLRVASLYCARCGVAVTYPSAMEIVVFRRTHLIPGATHRSDIGRAGFDARLPEPPSGESP